MTTTHELKNGEATTIKSFAKLSYRISARPSTDSAFKNHHRVLKDGKDVGQFDSYSQPDLPELLDGVTVQGIELTLSNDMKVTLHDRQITVITSWETKTRTYRTYFGSPMINIPTKKTFFNKKVPINDDTSLTWDELAKIPPENLVGSTVAEEFPFQWVDETLTNGRVSFPRQRPKGLEWKNCPVRAMSPKGWKLFLGALEGRFLRDMIAILQHATTNAANERQSGDGLAQKVETEDERKLRRVIEAQMWQGSDAVTRVSIGMGVVFIVPRTEALGTAYVVDNPDVGAIYLFATYDEAVALASGATRRISIRPNQRHVDHVAGWEEELVLALNEVADRFAGLTPS